MTLLFSIRNKIVIVAFVVAIIFVPLLFIYFPNVLHESLMEAYNHEVDDKANTIALGVNIALTEKNFEGVETALKYVKSDSRLVYVAIVSLDTVHTGSSFTINKTVFSEFPSKSRVDYNLMPNDSISISRSAIESDILKGEVLVVYSTRQIFQKIQHIKNVLFLSSFIIFLIAVLLGFIMAKRISASIKQLTKATILVSKGKFDVSVDIKTKDELAVLAKGFNEMVRKLNENNTIIKQQELVILNFYDNLIAEKNKRIADSIQYASRIQASIIPNTLTLQSRFDKSFLFHKAKDIVSGDFPWMQTNKDCTYIAAIDCTGHGVPGAMLTMIGYFLLNQITRNKSFWEPGEVLDKLHINIQKTLRQNHVDGLSMDGMDIALCKINVTDKTLSYAGAHRDLMYLNVKGELVEWKGNRKGIGGHNINDDKFMTHHIQYDTGDRIFAFSDGLSDQFGGIGKKKKFGKKRIREIILSTIDKNIETVHQTFLKEFESWKGEEEQTDDVIMIGLEF